jgi:hypothetical protein
MRLRKLTSTDTIQTLAIHSGDLPCISGEVSIVLAQFPIGKLIPCLVTTSHSCGEFSWIYRECDDLYEMPLLIGAEIYTELLDFLDNGSSIAEAVALASL